MGKSFGAAHCRPYVFVKQRIPVVSRYRDPQLQVCKNYFETKHLEILIFKQPSPKRAAYCIPLGLPPPPPPQLFVF